MFVRRWKMTVKPVFWQYSLAFVCVVSWTAAPSLAGILFTKVPENPILVPLYGTANLTWSFTFDGGSETLRRVTFYYSTLVSVADFPPKFIINDFRNKVDVSVVGNTVTLWILNVSAADVTSYRIDVATTITTYSGIPSVSLQILIPPIIKIEPNAQTVCENDPVVLSCVVEEGNPPPTVVWKNESDGTVLKSSNTTQTNYSISQVGRQQSGNYSCQATNVAGSANKVTNLNVEWKPIGTQLQVDPMVNISAVKRGSLIMFNCTATDLGNPPVQEYRFYYNNILLGVSLSGLFTTSVNSSGKYECAAINSAASCGQSSITGNIMINIYEPAAIIKASCQPAVYNLSMTCTCETMGEPIPRVRWINTAGESLVNDTSGISNYTNNRVEFSLHGSYYTCVAYNGHGDKDERNSSQFDVFRGPLDSTLLTVQPSNRIRWNTMATFNCTAEVNPPNDVNFQLNYKNQKMGESKTGQFSVLVHEGGDYICTASNEYGDGTKAVPVVVFDPLGVSVTESPKTVNENENLTLICTATGIPSPTSAKWVFGGRDLTNQAGVSIKESRTREQGRYIVQVALYLHNVTRSFSGSFICTANVGNEIRNATVNVNVTGMCTPFCKQWYYGAI